MAGRAQYEPFDEGDDFNALADRIRRDVGSLIHRLQDNDLYRGLSPTAQIECVMAGLSVGLVGTCFAQIHPTGRDEMMRAIKDYLPQARAQAESILSGRE